MSRVRVKVCGITRPEDAILASRSGADAIGLVFYGKSQRCVDVEQAKAIRAALPAFVSLVALFVNPAVAQVRELLDSLAIDCLQFHGDESPDFCAQFAHPYMKALRVRDNSNPLPELERYAGASAILLDSFDPALAGGTGKTFDWSIASRCVAGTSQAIVLAGGLTSDNVVQAIEQVRPWAVDVSSGVESEPGIKCRKRMSEFFNEVYRVQSAAAI